MAGRGKRREVVVQDNVIGVLQGETFIPESNFMIKDLHYITYITYITLRRQLKVASSLLKRTVLIIMNGK
jgi:hypothetical protein